MIKTVSLSSTLLFREPFVFTHICPFLRPCFDFPLKLLALGFYKSVFHTGRVGFGFSMQCLASTEAGNAEGNESVRLVFFQFKCLFQIWEEVEWFLSISSLASGTCESYEAQRTYSTTHHTHPIPDGEKVSSQKPLLWSGAAQQSLPSTLKIISSGESLES